MITFENQHERGVWENAMIRITAAMTPSLLATGKSELMVAGLEATSAIADAVIQKMRERESKEMRRRAEEKRGTDAG